MGFLPNIRKKVNKAKSKAKTRVQKAAEKTKAVTQKLKGNVKQRMENAVKSKGFVVLTPYKPMMIKILRKRGHNITNSSSIAAVSKLFYDAVIKGKSHFDYASYNRTEHLAATAIIAGVSAATPIVLGILAWIKDIKLKKAQGQQLTEEQTIAANEDEKIEAAGDKISVDEESEDGFFTRLFRALFGGKKKRKENFRRRIDSRNVKPAKKIVTAKTPYVNQPLNATELTMSSLAAKGGIGMNYQNFRQGVVGSANDVVNITPNLTQGKLKPNSWWLNPKTGKWNWVGANGKIWHLQ